MERTQIYLDETQKESLKNIAKQHGNTMAELIREAITQYIARTALNDTFNIKETAGIWEDRNDIYDSSEYIDDMRKKWGKHSEESPDE